jgi:hypothetical protein
MDSRNQIGDLLERYWKCETSLEEEQALRNYFLGNAIPSDMQEAAQLFRFFEAEKQKNLGENFEPIVTKELQRRRGGKIISLVTFTQVARIAAGVLVLVVATFFIRQEIRKSYPQEVQDTYTDPQLAFEETKKALLMIGNTFGKARHEASKMKMFNEAEKKIQGKAGEKVSI